MADSRRETYAFKRLLSRVSDRNGDAYMASYRSVATFDDVIARARILIRVLREDSLTGSFDADPNIRSKLLHVRMRAVTVHLRNAQLFCDLGRRDAGREIPLHAVPSVDAVAGGDYRVSSFVCEKWLEAQRLIFLGPREECLRALGQMRSLLNTLLDIRLWVDREEVWRKTSAPHRYRSIDAVQAWGLPERIQYARELGWLTGPRELLRWSYPTQRVSAVELPHLWHSLQVSIEDLLLSADFDEGRAKAASADWWRRTLRTETTATISARGRLFR